jgi:hypothetical protein
MNIIMFTIVIVTSITVGSPHNVFTGKIVYYPGTELRTQQFTLYTEAGERVYDLYDHPAHTYYICDNGSVFAMNEHELWYINVRGEVLWQRSIEGVNRTGFSSEGAIFYVSEKTAVCVYDCSGAMRYELPPARLFTSCDGGERIVMIAADTAYCYEHGVLQYAIALPSCYAWDISLSDDQEDMVIEFKDHLEIIDLDTGKRRSP